MQRDYERSNVNLNKHFYWSLFLFLIFFIKRSYLFLHFLSHHFYFKLENLSRYSLQRKVEVEIQL